jgi:hypothetical protein
MTQEMFSAKHRLSLAKFAVKFFSKDATVSIEGQKSKFLIADVYVNFLSSPIKNPIAAIQKYFS